MKNKKVLIIIIVIAVLAAGVAIFAILNAGDTGAKQASQENATVTVKQGDTSKTFDLIYLKAFEKVEFSATMDTSKTGPQEKKFGGVPLATALKELGFDLDGAKQIIFTAADGYASVVTAEEAKDSENVYLVYERDGEPTLSKQQGGSGPIEIVIRKDQFSQRWCKFLMEIDIQ
jgi:hypothetical protein